MYWLVVTLLLFSDVNSIRIGIIEDHIMVDITYTLLFNITEDQCICQMMNLNQLLSALNYFQTNQTCQLFSSNQTSVPIQFSSNSSFIFINQSSISITNIIPTFTTNLIANSTTTITTTSSSTSTTSSSTSTSSSTTSSSSSTASTTSSSTSTSSSSTSTTSSTTSTTSSGTSKTSSSTSTSSSTTSTTSSSTSKTTSTTTSSSTSTTTTTTTPPSTSCVSPTSVIINNNEFIYSPTSQVYAAGMLNNQFGVYRSYGYKNVTSSNLWTANQTSTSVSCLFAMQTDRNLVVYSTGNSSVMWSAYVQNNGAGSPFCLKMLDSGNLIWITNNGSIIWQTNTAQSG